MTAVQRIRGAVYRAIDSVNDLLPTDKRIEATDDVILVGHSAVLDSMGFVNFIVALEAELEGELGKTVNIGDLLDVKTSQGDAISTAADFIRAFTADRT
jgi:hypothetical protein